MNLVTGYYVVGADKEIKAGPFQNEEEAEEAGTDLGIKFGVLHVEDNLGWGESPPTVAP